MGFLKEFTDFLNEQKIIAVALAFIVGIATATLVQALVKDIITPAYSPYLDWLNPDAFVTVGRSKFMVGDFISNVLNWVVIILVVFIIVKGMMRKSKAE
jgi:large conductance mechanosensitive channel